MIGLSIMQPVSPMSPDNIVLLTLDSCRYDVFLNADMPFCKSLGSVRKAQAPANFTYASHQAFFEGILPLSSEPIPYYNRYVKQLYGIQEVGETNVVKNAHLGVNSTTSFFEGLRNANYRIFGCGAMNWFKQASLTSGFDEFLFTGTAADLQVDFIISRVSAATSPFFAFINFGETHFPYVFEGKEDQCPVTVLARTIHWPPRESGPVGKANPAYSHQVAAASFLDKPIHRLVSNLPEKTFVVVCGDHGECFGEDGFWGHGFNHAKVLEVPLLIFKLDSISGPTHS